MKINCKACLIIVTVLVVVLLIVNNDICEDSNRGKSHLVNGFAISGVKISVGHAYGIISDSLTNDSFSEFIIYLFYKITLVLAKKHWRRRRLRLCPFILRIGHGVLPHDGYVRSRPVSARWGDRSVINLIRSNISQAGKEANVSGIGGSCVVEFRHLHIKVQTPAG